MCGISGFFGDIAKTSRAQACLTQMMNALAHRGPDGQDMWLGPEVGLAHNRLAIIDLNTGEQPMWDRARKNVIIFNGEIYNYPDLRAELERKGYAFDTQSDTEVIPASLDAWGIDEGLRRLRGMFAFALYNTETHRLLLARDRVGIKPLYIAQTPQGVLFASEQKALLTSDLVSRRVNLVALHDYLSQGFPITPDTCWADIQMLQPGSWLELSPAGTRRGHYWSWQPDHDESLDLDGAIEQVEHTFRDALRGHLLSDVPLAAFLSGGLDSSLIIAYLSQGLAPDINAFNMAFGDATYDENDAARAVAQHCGVQLHAINMQDFKGDADLFVRILNQYDEPFGDSSCLPTYLLAREMSRHVKVVISGDGGDETLGGYRRYLYAYWLGMMHRSGGCCARSTRW
jgi:asparagine synthase (glutamine-hydrolysing)